MGCLSPVDKSKSKDHPLVFLEICWPFLDYEFIQGETTEESERRGFGFLIFFFLLGK